MSGSVPRRRSEVELDVGSPINPDPIATTAREADDMTCHAEKKTKPSPSRLGLRLMMNPGCLSYSRGLAAHVSYTQKSATADSSTIHNGIHHSLSPHSTRPPPPHARAHSRPDALFSPYPDRPLGNNRRPHYHLHFPSLPPRWPDRKR